MGQRRRAVGQRQINRGGLLDTAAGDGIGEAVVADVAAGRGVNHLAVADANRTVRAVGDAGNRFVAVGEAVVGQDIDRDRGARMGCPAVVMGVLHWRDGNIEGGGLHAVVAPVGDLISDLRHAAVPVGDRNKGIAAVGVDGQRAIARKRRGLACGPRRCAHRKCADFQRIAVRVAGAVQQILQSRAGQRLVFRCAGGFADNPGRRTVR